MSEPTLKKRKLTNTRVVNSIDSSLDPVNYKPLKLSSSKDVHIGYLGPRKKKDTKQIKWTEEKPTIKGKQRKQDVIKGTPGVRGDLAKSADTP